MILLGIGLVLLAVFAVRFHSDRRRLGNGVFLSLGVIFTVVWLITVTYDAILDELVLALVFAAPLALLVAVGLLVVNGAQLVRREGVHPHTLLPFALAGLVLAPYVLLVAALATGEHWFAVGAASATLVVGYVAWLLAAFLLYSFLYRRLGYRSGADAIVVHGAGLDGGSVPPLLASRLDRAVEVYRREVGAGGAPVIVTSGGKGPDERVAEAEAMSGYLLARGLPPEVVLREDDSTSTEENLRCTARLLAERGCAGRMVLVTSNFHVLRTAVLARGLGLDAEVVGARTAFYYLPAAVLREFAALVVQYRRINLSACVVLVALPPLVVLTAGGLPVPL